MRVNGNFTLFVDYNGGVDFANGSPNMTYRQVNLTVDNYLDCYQRCREYNRETLVLEDVLLCTDVTDAFQIAHTASSRKAQCLL